MNRPIFNALVLALTTGCLVAACSNNPSVQTATAINGRALTSGIDVRNMDTKVRPQDDFYRYTNGAWLQNTPIPADKSRWGSFDELRENALDNLRVIVDGIVAQKGKASGSEAQKIGDLYESFMDEARRCARSPTATGQDPALRGALHP